MDLTFRVPNNPDDSIKFWVNHYESFSNLPELDIPYTVEKLCIRNKEFYYWTLNPKLHNFFKQHNIRYSLKFDDSQHKWVIHFLSNEYAILFKLCWIDTKDVYDNY